MKPPRPPRPPAPPPEDSPMLEIRVEEPCHQCFGRGHLAQGRVTHACPDCHGLGVRVV